MSLGQCLQCSWQGRIESLDTCPHGPSADVPAEEPTVKEKKNGSA